MKKARYSPKGRLRQNNPKYVVIKPDLQTKRSYQIKSNNNKSELNINGLVEIRIMESVIVIKLTEKD